MTNRLPTFFVISANSGPRERVRAAAGRETARRWSRAGSARPFEPGGRPGSEGGRAGEQAEQARRPNGTQARVGSSSHAHRWTEGVHCRDAPAASIMADPRSSPGGVNESLGLRDGCFTNARRAARQRCLHADSIHDGGPATSWQTTATRPPAQRTSCKPLTRDPSTPTPPPPTPCPCATTSSAAIHKALRLHTDTLSRLGAPTRSTTQVDAAVAQVRDLLDMCEQHLEGERVHPPRARSRPARERRADRRRPRGAPRGRSPTCATWPAWWPTRAGARSAAFARLYRATARFCRPQLEHMAYEEAGITLHWAGLRRRADPRDRAPTASSRHSPRR